MLDLLLLLVLAAFWLVAIVVGALFLFAIAVLYAIVYAVTAAVDARTMRRVRIRRLSSQQVEPVIGGRTPPRSRRGGQ